MNRFASTRSLKCASQPSPGRAQCSVGSIEDDGILYGLTTHALRAKTMRTAPTIVKIQSSVTRVERGRFGKRRPSGSLTARDPVATRRPSRGRPTAAPPPPANRGTRPGAGSAVTEDRAGPGAGAPEANGTLRQAA